MSSRVFFLIAIAAAAMEAKAMNRVGNGVQTRPNEYPWMVLVKAITSQTRHWNGDIQYKFKMCGGSLISDQWVVTAAHCFDEKWLRVEVELGQHNRNTKAIEMTISRVIIHEDYGGKPSKYNNDIALLQLPEPVSFNRYVSPICLPSKRAGSFAGLRATVAGWGNTEHGSLSHVLLKTEVNVLSNAACRKYVKYGNHAFHFITDAMLCIVPDRQDSFLQGSCMGDSGGPLMVQQGNSNTLIGIVSWAGSDNGCSTKKSPAVYVRVTKFLDWIKENTGGSNICES